MSKTEKEMAAIIQHRNDRHDAIDVLNTVWAKWEKKMELPEEMLNELSSALMNMPRSVRGN